MMIKETPVNDLGASKSLLAKLMAQENITVQHRKVQTPFFDLKNRVLVLPIWQDMNGDLYDLCCGHEVGHTLWTPAEGWHQALADSPGFKTYLNVLEDARIERKIKTRYPGLSRGFLNAYRGLWERDFFGVKNRQLNGLPLIDRINLSTKLGPYVALDLDFNAEEQAILDRVHALETWAEVEALARELWIRAKEHQGQDEQQKLSEILTNFGEGEEEDEDSGQDEGEDLDLDPMPGQTDDLDEEQEDEYNGDDLSGGANSNWHDPSSITDQNFRERESELLDPSSLNYVYVTMPALDSRKFILPWRDTMQQLQFGPFMEAQRAQLLADFMAKNTRYVNYMVKEFELRRNASTQARTRIARSGEIDTKRLQNYRFSEDLFRRFSVAPNGKNHGLIVTVDMSGSMQPVMPGVIEQLVTLAMFCRKAAISFELYGFTDHVDSNDPGTQYYNQDFENRWPQVEGTISSENRRFRLIEFFSDRMSGMQFKRQISNLVIAMDMYRMINLGFSRYSLGEQLVQELDNMPHVLRLGGTPLRETAALGIDMFNRFRARTGTDVVNMMYISDGDAAGQLSRWHRSSYSNEYVYSETIHDRNTNVVLTDSVTRAQVQSVGAPFHGVDLVLNLVRKVTGANVVGMHLGTGNMRRAIAERMYSRWVNQNEAEIGRTYDQLRRNRVAVIETRTGYDEYYVVRGTDMAIEEEALDAEANTRKLARNFLKMQRNKQTNRVLIQRLIGMLA